MEASGLADNTAMEDTRHERTRRRLVAALLGQRNHSGHWEGELSTSALSTATAVCALHRAGPDTHRRTIDAGLRWLAANANPDGGWGDTIKSHSNISTTALCWAALALGDGPAAKAAENAAADWLAEAAGGLEPGRLVAAIIARYGGDRTFSIPILTMLTICGRLGPPTQAWRHIPPLPFELAALPQRLYKWLRLPVVSYALPALIAIGQVIHHHRGAGNPVTGLLRRLARRRTLRTLAAIQPQNGGFLEAIPLTAFVAMSLAAMGRGDHAVVLRGIEFLTDRQRPDGSWPIDTHLATWVTTLAVNALTAGGPDHSHFGQNERKQLVAWLLEQQYRRVHAYTGAAPGGWSWTPLPGGVPDADDTAGALLALARLEPAADEVRAAAAAGIDWLLSIQNRDGGIPTFCKGWGRLPFDKSCADITAHALQAIATWGNAGLSRRSWQQASAKALRYLLDQQRADGAWIPLWFGNQDEVAQHNPCYGTARVLSALTAIKATTCSNLVDAEGPFGRRLKAIRGALDWLLSNQHPSGGWGAAAGVAPSIEETALAVTALGRAKAAALSDEDLGTAIDRGRAWLIQATGEGRDTPAAPIGFYFANLWYYEVLYPLIFAVECFEA